MMSFIHIKDSTTIRFVDSQTNGRTCPAILPHLANTQRNCTCEYALNEGTKNSTQIFFSFRPRKNLLPIHILILQIKNIDIFPK